ncbi:hypothetical protein AB0N17_35330 [Streptomyces sp. NPDC051133]|uniref:hypothetical protein n=1 Tax=Streptomyces sp. NPDC051133 TaxID=3155521 RepID=UPI003427B657
MAERPQIRAPVRDEPTGSLRMPGHGAEDTGIVRLMLAEQTDLGEPIRPTL